MALLPSYVDQLNREKAGDPRLVDVLTRVSVHEAAPLHGDARVGDVEHEAQYLLADDNAEIADAADVAQQAGNVPDDRGLDALGRLVKQQHLRIAGKRARDRELLLLAARQVAATSTLEILEHGEEI